MLTRSGWLTIIVAVIGAAVARAFAITELFVIAAGLGLLVIGCFLWARLTTLRLRVGRTVQPARVFAGETTRVEVTATNTAGQRTPVLSLTDPVAGTRGALLHLAPLKAGDQARAAYRLPTSKRGLVRVGPLKVEMGDPFGLTRRRATAAPVLDVTVYPAIHRITVPNLGGDEDPHGSSARNHLGRTSDEFYAMREYVRGDDLRRVNWKATARRDDLMVRQDERPWQDRTTVVFDTRSSSYDDASFERAVSAAASVTTAAFGARHIVRFLAGDGTDTNAATGMQHGESVLDYLAAVQPSSSASLRTSIEVLSKSAQGGLLVIVAGDIQSAELLIVNRLRRRYRRTVVLACHGHAPVAAAGIVVADLTDPDTDFADAWATASRSRRVANPVAS
jgi:uncharacterized protein (DUF58 family)